METCPCGSDRQYDECCAPVISGARVAATAEELMRSRYTAYVKTEVDHVFNTSHSSQREKYDKKSIQDWSKKSEWLGLEIIDTRDGGPEDNEGEVEFVANYRMKGERMTHHEIASFKKEDGQWFFYDGHTPKTEQVVRSGPKVGRNDPCTCGSGKKFKKCCGK